MAVLTFAQPDELRKRLDLDASALSDSRATQFLEDVSGDIREVLGWSVTEEQNVILTLDSLGTPHLFLPTRHLTAVASVVEDGVALTFGTQYTWTDNGVLTRGGPASVRNWTASIPKPRSVVVTFTHGYPSGQVPAIFRTVCLDHTVPLIPNPAGLRNLQVSGVGQTYDAQTMLGAVKAGEDPRLDRYRLLR